MIPRSFLCAVVVAAVELIEPSGRSPPLPIGEGDASDYLTIQTLATPPAIEQHFSPAEDLERIDVSLIGEAGERIDMAAYVLTDFSVIEALTQAAARGVRVRVYRQPDERPPLASLTAALARLTAAGAETRAKPAGAPLMHLKAYCVDGRVLRIGAANFSHSGLTQQDNDLELYRFPDACKAFEADFERMWSAR
jgi:phosphatidylserine/phosphatidylglycerophosphate/cardiolipin synthase-like enzyme